MATADRNADDQTPLYTVAAVARRTGIAPVTLRAWERRYGFPRPSRTPGRQRLYSERDVQAIAELQTQTARGVPISRAIALLVGGDADNASPGQAASRLLPLDRLGQRLVDACLAMDTARAEAALSEALSVLSVEDACLGVLEPALNEVGRRWANGESSIAQEHFASAIVRARLAAMFVAYSSDADTPNVLAACPPGEWHELGLLMVCLFLVRRGARVRYLGANLPIHELAAVAHTSQPAVVILSAQSAATAEQVVSALRAIERLGPPAPLCGYGGWVFKTSPLLRAGTPGTYLGNDAGEAAARVLRMLRAALRAN